MLQVIDIHSSYNILLGRPCIHTAGAMASSLHQCLKYMMNRIMIIVKTEEIISIIRNMAIPFIEVEDCRDGNIHAFEIMNVKWVPKGAALRKPRISKATRMVPNDF
jgi:hypothetical protein